MLNCSRIAYLYLYVSSRNEDDLRKDGNTFTDLPDDSVVPWGGSSLIAEIQDSDPSISSIDQSVAAFSNGRTIDFGFPRGLFPQALFAQDLRCT